MRPLLIQGGRLIDPSRGTDETTDVPASRLAMAVWACPMQAITLVGDNGEEVSVP